MEGERLRTKDANLSFRGSNLEGVLEWSKVLTWKTDERTSPVNSRHVAVKDERWVIM